MTPGRFADSTIQTWRRRQYGDRDAAYEKLVVEFGAQVYRWPKIHETRPGLLQFRRRAAEARINDALATIGRGPIDETMRAVFWWQIRLGQDVAEDAGGYMWRCWRAAIGFDVRERAAILVAT